jgi:large subunit ribosomal protein L30
MPRRFIYHGPRGPKRTAKDEPAGTGKLQITQVKSGIGQPGTMRATLEAIGLRHHQATIVKQDSPSLRGQIKHVRHLLKVTPVKE